MCALLEFFHQSHNVLLIISKTCQSVWDLALPIAKEMYCRPCVSDVLTSFFTSTVVRVGKLRHAERTLTRGGCHGNVAAKWTWLFCGCESLLLVNKNTTGKSYSAGVQDFIFHPLLLFYFRKKIIEKRLISPFLFSFLHEIQNKKPLAAVYGYSTGLLFFYFDKHL